jgi:UDP-N-acetylglucosamine:LPS N-acetylglucosamine transferase
MQRELSVAGWCGHPAATGPDDSGSDQRALQVSAQSLQEMAERARELAKPEATAVLARMCEELVK